MASFTTRVELHDAVWSDYTKLHTEMQGIGFGRAIRADDGRVYTLPTAEYDFIGDYTASQVLELAKSAAAKTGKAFAALVTEGPSRAWYNLPQIK